MLNDIEPDKCNRCCYATLLPGQRICEACEHAVREEEKQAKEIQLYEDVETLKDFVTLLFEELDHDALDLSATLKLRNLKDKLGR